MPHDAQLSALLNALSQIVRCAECETRLRFGDHECPHCGKDVDDELHDWAERLLRELAAAV